MKKKTTAGDPLELTLINVPHKTHFNIINPSKTVAKEVPSEFFH